MSTQSAAVPRSPSPLGAPAERRRSTREIAGYGGLFLVVASVGALFVSDLSVRRRELTRDAEASALQQSRLMARWFGATILATDHVLLDLMDRLPAEGPVVTGTGQARRIHETLVRKAGTVPGLTGLGYYGPDCVFRDALDPAVVGFRSNQAFCSDRSVRIGAEMQVQYLPASKSADRRPALILSRNRVDPSGALLGGTLGVIHLDHAQRWIEQFGALGPNVMAMVDDAARVLARVPPVPQEVGEVAPLPDGHAFPSGAWESGGFTGAWPLDGVVRICGVGRIDAVPLAIVVGLDRDAVLREWRLRCWQLIPGYLLLSGLAFAVLRAYLESLRQRAGLQRAVTELQTALENVRVLRGLLPICASCKKIRDDKGYWNRIESYLYDHTGAEFSHGICPDCMERLYPEDEGSGPAPATK